MSKEDRYYTAPLSILRSGGSALDALEACMCSGIVNAGIGYRETHSEDEYESLLEQADDWAEGHGSPTSPPKKFMLLDANGRTISRVDSEELWKAAQAGAKLLGVRGGRVRFAQRWATHYRPGEVFFKIKAYWLWGAIYTARREAGQEIENDFKPLSWREFRILAAILSAPVNKVHGFVFLGWESIQARACGFHKKSLLAENRATLPEHCLPLSRSQIDLTTSRLEVLKFYLRFRYSKGNRGGKTAYSFRHESREKLAEAVHKYQDEYCFKPTLNENRTKDRALSLRMAATPQGSGKSPAT